MRFVSKELTLTKEFLTEVANAIYLAFLRGNRLQKNRIDDDAVKGVIQYEC